MKERITMRIISAVVGLALVGAAIYLVAIDRAEHVDTLITIGIAALGLAGVVLPSPFGAPSQSSKKPPRKPPTLPLAALLLMIAVVVVGCGASANSQHRTLNTITSAADPTYELALEGCDTARDAIVARTGTTYAEDIAAMGDVNRVCDGIVLGFETLRSTQLTARAAIDAGAEGAIREAILEALRLWAQLQQMIPELDTLGRTGGA